ncbi:MAG: LysM domain-containing protein [bacterium]
MPRLRYLAIATLLGSIVPAVPARAHAQGSAALPPTASARASKPRTYTVREGDTLWELARTLLGDPHRWERLYRLNLGVVLNPRSIEPGMVLRLNDSEPVASLATGATATADGVASAITDVRVVTSGEPETPSAGQSTSPAAAAQAASAQAAPAGVRPARSQQAARATAVRAGDFLTAPFVIAIGGPQGAGKIDRALGSSFIATTPRLRSIQFRDLVRVALPAGAVGAIGDQLLVIRLAQVLGTDAQVAVPVGVLTVTVAAARGMVDAELTRKFEDVTIGQPVIVADPLASPVGVFPVATASGRETRVRWISGASVLSAPGQYLIVGAGSNEGLVSGDQLSLRDVANAEVEVGVARVTRVTTRGATAIVLHVRNGGVAIGGLARVSAKMP